MLKSPLFLIEYWSLLQFDNIIMRSLLDTSRINNKHCNTLYKISVFIISILLPQNIINHIQNVFHKCLKPNSGYINTTSKVNIDCL